MNAETLRDMSASPAAFRASLLIPTGDGPKPLGDVVAEFQRRDFAILDAAFMAVRDGRRPTPGRIWQERTKGASKDTDAAVEIVWLMIFTQRALTIQIAAADQEQADELRKAIRDVVRLNPWIDAAGIKVLSASVVSTRSGSECSILTTDSKGSHGSRPDIVLCNELSHTSDREFIETLLDNAEKVPTCLGIILTNAGFVSSWQHDWREKARTSDRWAFSAYSQPAPWLDASSLEDRKTFSTPNRIRRLWYGEWVAAAGDALDESDIEAAFINPDITPIDQSEQGYVYAAGLDLGLTRDNAAFVILAKHIRTGRLRLASVKIWRPKQQAGGKVAIADVEETILQAHKRFRWTKANADPWQGVYLLDRLRAARVPFEQFAMPPSNADRLCRAVLNEFSERNIELYRHADIERDLRSATITEGHGGKLRLSSPRNEHGHGDALSALSLAILAIPEARAPQYVGLPVGYGRRELDLLRDGVNDFLRF